MNNKQREESLTLEILEAIEAQSDLTQRHLARRTGVALGLANSYLKRCVRKGLVKIQQAPANRYLYYLTPKGFAEKSRLTAQYLSYSFTFYRRAADSCAHILAECARRGLRRVALYGASDLAEIAALRAIEHGVRVIAVCDPEQAPGRLLNIPLIGEVGECADAQAWVVTDLRDPQAGYERLLATVASEQVFVPDILGVRRLD